MFPTAVLSVLCVMFQVQLPFVVNLSSVFPVQLPNFSLSFFIIIIIIIIIINVVSCHRPFLPGTSLEPAVIPTAQASSFTLHYFPYYV